MTAITGVVVLIAGDFFVLLGIVVGLHGRRGGFIVVVVGA